MRRVSFLGLRPRWAYEGGSQSCRRDWQTIRALVIYLPTPADHRVREAKPHQG
jgi:hypothetical protein